MARVYAIQAAKRQAAIPSLKSQGDAGGQIQSLYDKYTYTADLASGDVIEFGDLPAGARVIGAQAKWSDLDGSGGTIDIGWEASANGVEAASPAGFFSNLDVTAAGFALLSATPTIAGLFKKFAAPVKVIATIDGDTDATTGDLELNVLYVID